MFRPAGQSAAPGLASCRFPKEPLHDGANGTEGAGRARCDPPRKLPQNPGSPLAKKFSKPEPTRDRDGLW